jgi:protein-S-isoprenylcysteine O-methyltransferase Ste14
LEGQVQMKPRVPPPVVTLIAALIMWGLHRLRPTPEWISPPWDRLGLLTAALGIAVNLTAFMRFRQARTTINPMDPSKATRLVTDGIFSLSRNPMYLGFLLLLVGWALWLRSAWVWLIPPSFVVGITRWQIVPEEQALTQLFGAQYSAYRDRVARWIGRNTARAGSDRPVQ